MIIFVGGAVLMLLVQAYLIAVLGKTHDIAKANNLMLNALIQGRSIESAKVKIPKIKEEPYPTRIPKTPPGLKKATRNVTWTDERRKLASQRHKEYWAKRKAGQSTKPTAPDNQATAASAA